MMMRVLTTVMIGIGATISIDLWSMFLRRVFAVASLDYCVLGRWILYMPEGRLMHAGIKGSAPKRNECAMGWTAHYSIGIGFALAFITLVGQDWIERPTILPALLFGVATVAVPFLTMQPAMGLGIASSRAKNPWAARLKSLTTHTVFGVGLYASAWVASR